jgi:protein-histidine pros-kinase
MKPVPKKRQRCSQEPPEVKKRILIIDDDPVAACLLRDYLRNEKGFEVFTAETGAEGIRAAVEHVPDLVMLDSRLVDMSGLEAHEILRQDPATKDIPVIYSSSFLTLRTIEQATMKGAKGFISKPFTPSEIYTKVATALSSP